MVLEWVAASFLCLLVGVYFSVAGRVVKNRPVLVPELVSDALDASGAWVVRVRHVGAALGDGRQSIERIVVAHAVQL